jgi:hypothetical protein
VSTLFSKRIQLELNRVSQRVKSLDTFLWKKKIIQKGFIYCSLRLHNKIPWEKLLYNFPKVSSGIKSGRLTGLFSDQFFLHCYAELRDSITIRSREKIAEIKASVQFSKLFQLESNRVSKEVNSSYSMLLCSCCTASNAVYKFNVLLTFYNCFLYSYENRKLFFYKTPFYRFLVYVM